MTELILMLTKHDITVPNALDVFEEIKNTGLKFIGCKDIGLSKEKLQELFKNIKSAGMTTFLEVVSNDEEKHFAGVETAIDVGADYLIGGMPQFVGKTLDYLKSKKTHLKFFPYVGKVVGHPCMLEGDIDEIINQGMEFTRIGAQGINLLLYRYNGDVNCLLNKAVQKFKSNLIVAGNVDNFEKIKRLKRENVWAFTIGGAILERKLVPGKTIKEQVIAVLRQLR